MGCNKKIPNEISLKIIDDWGTMTHFCRKNGINYNTFKTVLYGNATSTPIAEKLKKHGYIKDASELQKKSA